MRKEITEKIEIPQGIEVEINEHEVKLKKAGKEISRKYSGFEVRKEGNTLVLHHKKATKKEKKEIKTLVAHLKNAVYGLENKFIYKLQICSVHFPMNVAVDKAKNEVVIKNFLGEVKPRIARIVSGVEVRVEKEFVVVSGENKDNTGQTSANIEKATRITNRDRRTFQDGIYLVSRDGEGI